MKKSNEGTNWFQVYNNLDTLNVVSKRRMDIKKELVVNNLFYKNEEKYDILLDDLVKECMTKNPTMNINSTSKNVNLTSKEYWNKLYNLKK